MCPRGFFGVPSKFSGYVLRVPRSARVCLRNSCLRNSIRSTLPSHVQSLIPMRSSRLSLLLAVVLVFNGVVASAAMIEPCHSMDESAPAQHLHHANSEHPAPAMQANLPCDGLCCDGMACPGHASAAICSLPLPLRTGWSEVSLRNADAVSQAPLAGPVIPPFRPPAC